MALDGKAFRVTSILISTGATPSLAVINGRAYSEGEFVRMPRTPGTAPVRVRVQRINDGTGHFAARRPDHGAPCIQRTRTFTSRRARRTVARSGPLISFPV